MVGTSGRESVAVELTVQALKVQRSRVAQHVKCPATMLPSAFRGTLRVEPIALPNLSCLPLCVSPTTAFFIRAVATIMSSC